MPGLAPLLPLNVGPVDGFYTPIKDYKNLVIQNFKMLLLTSPGEKIMNPDFGVGMKDFLFEQNVTQTQNAIASRINSQVNKYLPYINISDINFSTREQDDSLPPEYLRIAITFSVQSIGLAEVLVMVFNGFYVDVI
jgi:phage baseplate assembly protein W